MPSYPATRMRRNRRYDWSRRLAAEHTLSVDDLILPVFLCEGEKREEEIPSLPGVKRYSVDLLPGLCERVASLGIPAVALFPKTPQELKDEAGSEALNGDNLVCRAVTKMKQAAGNGLGVICDVALDPYTSHGHDGMLKGEIIANDETVTILSKQAVVLAQAGADYVAPSDMMDGRVGAVRKALDSGGYADTGIIAYAAKYASAFYGPFREAVGSKGALRGAGKATYQMDPANSKEAMAEIALDIEEGADMVMVKPGMPYLDIVRMAAERFSTPVLAYQVSGEYAMLRAAEHNGWLSFEASMLEALLGFKRAGASAILTYGACEVAALLKG